MNRSFIRRFFSRPDTAIAFGFLFMLALAALLLPMLAPASPWKMVGAPFLPPFSGRLLLGSDMLGRDVALSMLHGARYSLLIGLVSTFAATVVGVVAGALAGYFRGWVDDLLMAVTEFFQIVPGLVLILVLVTFMGPSIVSVVIGIAVVSWPNVARVVRAEVLSLRSRQYVEAAKTFGRRPLSILCFEVLPNAVSPIVVIASVMVASAILSESALSFLGLGDPRVVTWGYLIGAAQPYLREAWWLSALPGLAIALTVLAINLVGDGLASALNPRRLRRDEPQE